MGNKKTPLLQKLRNVGGTLYVFPSATEDIGLNLQSTTTGVAMSHFALLNIPKLTIDNCIKPCTHDVSALNGNEALAMSLQNYAMNFETLLTNKEDYNYQKLETVSEKVFWHWAMHVGILNPSDISNESTGNDDIYIEKAYNANENIAVQDNTVIKCFGSIDAGNSLSTEFGMFNETYINIPTSWGSGPVYLKHSDSDNYKLNTKHSIKDTGHLEGRGDSNEYYSYTRGQDYPCYDIEENNVYKYEIYDTSDGFEILKDLNQIQTASRNKFNNENLIFSSYDDINIDIENNLNIDQEFNFNTILLYYSVYDQDDLVKTAYATNLFGVIFLDGTKPEGEGFIIPTLTKRKSTTTQFGNSYSFRVNLKTMSVYDNTDAIIQDNTTMSGVSAVEFSDAISNLNRAIDIMNSNLTTTLAIQDQYASIISYYDNFEDDLRDISTCLNAYLKGTRSSFIDTSVLYTNEIRTSEAESLFDKNSILVRTHKESKDENGNIIYNDPVAIIKDDYIDIPILYNKTLHNKLSYIITEDDISTYLSINDPSNYNQYASVVTCIKAIDNAFNIDQKTGIVVKLRKREDPYIGEQSFNELYIAPDSCIFTKSTNENLKCLLDASNNVNYVALIPYIVNKVQRLNANSEGFTYNSGLDSFAEGRTNVANNNYSHAEGRETLANGIGSHTEGLNTSAFNDGEHAEGRYNASHTNTIHSIGIGTETNRANAVEVLNNGNVYITGLGGYNGTNPTNASTLQQVISRAGQSSLSNLIAGENIEITPMLNNRYTINANGYKYYGSENTYAEGKAELDIIPQNSHIEGSGHHIADIEYLHIEGRENIIGEQSNYSHVQGFGNTLGIESPYSFIGGHQSEITDHCQNSFVYGENTIADYSNMFVIGKNNQISDGIYETHWQNGENYGQELLSIGYGIKPNKRQTIFKVNGEFNGDDSIIYGELYTNDIYCDNIIYKQATQQGGDYAEYFEWADGNPNNEERLGLFVTLDDNGKINIATTGDDVIGVVSSTPGIIGNAAEQEWQGKYQKDIYGRKIMVKNEIIDDSSNIRYETHPVINPEYDPNIKYIPRSKRKEWAVIGFIGQFIVNDDGTCKAGKRCICGENGVATHTTSKAGYRVLKRLDETHIKIIASFL